MSSTEIPNARGFAGLLNLGEAHHHTVFAADFALTAQQQEELRRRLSSLPTQVHFLTLGTSPEQLLANLRQTGIPLDQAYVSMQVLTSSHTGFDVSRAVFKSIRRGDYTRLELPCQELGFSPRHADALLKVVSEADYQEQDTLSELFFSLLEKQSPYRIEVQTENAQLVIEDFRPWWQLGGRLRTGEIRILPGGEVAYTGDSVNGTLTIDGALLATPTRPEAVPRAAALGALSSRLAAERPQLRIENGHIVDIQSAGKVADELRSLFDAPAYRRLTEVGVSFNRACASFTHDWPASSNEGRPGVHVAVGGDPEAGGDAHAPMVHVDLMCARTSVWVNGELFLRTEP